jgi:hypothetical protein
VASGAWHSLRVDFQGSISSWASTEKNALEWDDDTFKDAGMIGVWTTAGSVTLFGDFTYTVKEPPTRQIRAL